MRIPESCNRLLLRGIIPSAENTLDRRRCRSATRIPPAETATHTQFEKCPVGGISVAERRELLARRKRAPRGTFHHDDVRRTERKLRYD